MPLLSKMITNAKGIGTEIFLFIFVKSVSKITHT